MVDFKVVLSDPRTGKSQKIDATGGGAGAFMGRMIGDVIDGAALGFEGTSIEITGGSDHTGIPARRDLHGQGRRRILLSKSTGFKPTHDGERRRKSLRGAEITADFVQINAKFVKYGDKPMEESSEPVGEEVPVTPDIEEEIAEAAKKSTKPKKKPLAAQDTEEDIAEAVQVTEEETPAPADIEDETPETPAK